MSLRSRLRRLRDLPDTVADVGGDLAEQVRRAHDYLEGAAPVVTSAVAASLRLTPGSGAYDLRHPLSAFERATSDVRDVGAVTREPAFFGLNRAVDIDSGDNPFGGGQEAAAQRAAKRVEGPLGVAARAGVRGFGMATDITNLAGGTSGGLGRIALRELGSAAGFGAAQSLAEEGLGSATERLGLGRAGGEAAGSFLGGPLVMGGGKAFATRVKALRTAAETGATPPGALGVMPSTTTTSSGGSSLLGGVARTLTAPARGPNEAIRSLVLPSSLRDPEITKALRTMDNWSESAGQSRAVSFRKQAQQPMDFLEQQMRDGLITETPVQARIADRWAAEAAKNNAQDVVAEVRRSVPAALENPNGFNLTAEQRRAVDRYHALTEQQFKREAGYDASPQAQRDNYVRHIYETDPRTAPIRGGFGAKQSQMKERTFDSYLEAASQGYRPATLNAADLMEARVKSGERAIAQKQLADTINAHPEWVRDHHAQGFQPVDIGARGVLDAKYIRDDIAEAINAHFKPRTIENAPGVKGALSTLGAARSLRLGWDLAMIGRMIPQAYAQAGPVRGTAVIAKALRDSMLPGGGKRVEELLTSARGQEAGLYMRGMAPGDLGDILAKEANGLDGWLKSHKLGATLKPEEWQFGTLIPALKFHLWDESVKAMKGKGAFQNITEEALKDQVGRRVDTLLSGFDAVRAGVSKNHEAVNRLAMLSPAWARGVVANLTDVTKSNAEGYMARRFWANMAVMGVSTSVALSLVATNDFSPEHIRRLLDPSSPDSVTNPKSKNFLGIELPGGNHINVWGPVVPIARVLLTPVASTIGNVNEAVEQDASLKDAIQAGLEGFFGGAADQGWRWGQGRRSVPVGIVQDVIRNKSFNNKAIATAETEEERRMQKALFAVQQLLPSISGVVVDTERVNQPEWDVSNPNRIVGAVAQAFGTSFTAGPKDPAAIQSKVSTFLRSQGVEPGQDPVGAYGRAINERQLDTVALAEFQADPANKDLRDHLQKRRIDKAEQQGRAVGREAAVNYTADTTRIDQRKTAAVAENDAAYRAGQKGGQPWSGEDWKKRNSEILADARIARGQSGTTWFGEDDPKKLRDAINRAYGSDEKHANDRAGELVEEYYEMRPKEDTPAGIQQFYEDRKAWLEKLKSENPADYERFKRVQDTRLSQVQKEYARAADLMGVYMEIPQYNGLTVDEGRRVNAILSRASAMKRAGLVRTERQGIMQDSRDPEMAFTARRYQGGRRTNRERSYFWQSHIELTKFFSGLLAADIDRVAGVT